MALPRQFNGDILSLGTLYMRVDGTAGTMETGAWVGAPLTAGEVWKAYVMDSSLTVQYFIWTIDPDNGGGVQFECADGFGILGSISIQGTAYVGQNLTVGEYAQMAYKSVVAVNKGTVTSAVTIDWSASDFQKFKLTTATNLTVTFTAPVAPNCTCDLTLRVEGAASGTPTITWPATVKGAPPTTVTATKFSLLRFVFDGTNYYYLAGTLNV